MKLDDIVDFYLIVDGVPICIGGMKRCDADHYIRRWKDQPIRRPPILDLCGVLDNSCDTFMWMAVDSSIVQGMFTKEQPPIQNSNNNATNQNQK